MVIVVDDADRENEGDLIMAAEKATPQTINFMTLHGRGLICVPISSERADQLGLQRMVAQNREMYRTDFTVSVDAAKGVTTGISAHDRAATIRTFLQMAIGKFLDPLEAVMAFLALVLVKWHGSLKNRRWSLVLGQGPI
jgi:3,4-dihydroxy-2-butanone 4-phosphate synthase